MITTHPKVAEATCVPYPSGVGEEEVLAFIVANRDEPDPLEITDWCFERLAYFKVPRYKTPTHKVQKYLLKKMIPDCTKECFDMAEHILSLRRKK